MLKKIFQKIFGKQQERSSRKVAQQTEIQSLPELTNADLDYLFSQLLEGVAQVRGQQWVLNFLQRIENRISQERWLIWLQNYGDRLLASPVPNEELAFRLIQLGELDVGNMGDLAYNIGMQLLARNSGNEYWQDVSSEPMVGGVEIDVPIANGNVITPAESNLIPPLPPLVENFEASEQAVFSESSHSIQEWVSEDMTPPISANVVFNSDIVNLNATDFGGESRKTNNLNGHLVNPRETNNLEESIIEQNIEQNNFEGNLENQALTFEFGVDLWNVESQPNVELNTLSSNFISDDLIVQEVDNSIENRNSENINYTSLEDTPGQQLLREFGEELWGENPHLEEKTEDTVATPLTGEEWAQIIDANYVEFSTQFHPQLVSDNLEEIISEQKQQQVVNETQKLEVITPKSAKEHNIEDDFDTPIMPVTRKMFESTSEHVTNTTFEQTQTNVLSIINVTLDELWARLQQSAQFAEQLASGLLNSANTQQLLIGNQPDCITTQAEGQAWFYQGLQQAKSGDLASAIASYDQAIALSPDAYEYWFNRGLALFHLQRLEEAIVSYENTIAIKPDYYKAWFNRGACLGELERFDVALPSFDKAIELKSDYDEAWSGKALALLKLGQISEAIYCYDRATQLEPQDAQAWYYRGVALSENKLYAEAITSFDEALEIQPQYYLAWFNRGLAQAQLEQWEDAVISYQKALKSQPGSYELWYLRGVALDKCQRYEDAIDSYDNALALNPELYDIWIDKGVIYANLGEWQEAIASWDQALNIQPHLYIGWFNKAIAHEKLGQPAEAILAYEEAVNIEPNFHLAWYNRGLLLFAIEKYEEAILSFDYTLQLQPEYLEAWIARANAVEKSPGFDYYLSSHSAIASANPSLTARGIDGKLTTYAAAVNYIDKDTYPEAWGKLYLTLGNAYYDRGKHYSFINDDWAQAIHAYNQALLTVNSENFPELNLEILQSITQVLLGFGDTNQALQFQTYATSLLNHALNDANISEASKKQLALKFSSLGQLAVDIAVQQGELVQALELAEYGKNTCLNYLLVGNNHQISSPNYNTIQKLVNSTTAIVYWHISPSGLRSFIIKQNHTEPILVFTPIFSIGEMDELPIPEAVERLTAFAEWLDDWQQQYSEYRTIKDAGIKDTGIEDIEANQNQYSWEHSWQEDMLHRLLKLHEILNISAIEQELEGITKLILIPHRDLCKLPLHALFQFNETTNLKLTITYLPTAASGLSRLNNSWRWEQQSLLSIEVPNHIGFNGLKSTKLETEAITQMFSKMKRILGAKASKQELQNEIKNYNILHFTGYVNNNTINPQQSEFLLAESDTLTVAEMSRTNLANYNLITLSAGEIVDINQQVITSEYVGIVTALMQQGVKHILSREWMVEPAVNGLVMVEFYRKLQQGKSATDALNEAIIWLKELTVGDLKKWYDNLLRKSPLGGVRIQALVATQLYRTNNLATDEKLYSHPYYWAGFKISGNLD
ncbi:CHAT domain-containing protein [Calothrix sp. UHCC 0171]|uniref:CHAT domain-containing protein n=1 Tax=Calothrix sp. UHCC 0171 TaxID=3110245 RepID=UPI002B1FF1AC|nr:tetratricopeptide repeat protein [Calothrix sp. UHCC 0171]MEA5569601.1 tetratricopeptide repeat protein [Calothrix sp. UHCC 0171]